MVIGLQFFFKSLPPDGLPGKSQPTDPETIQPLSFGEILKLKEKLLLQDSQVSASSVAAALAALQTRSIAMPLLAQEIEVVNPESSADGPSQPDVDAATQPAAARLTLTESSVPVTRAFSTLQTEQSEAQSLQVTMTGISTPSTVSLTKEDIPDDGTKSMAESAAAPDRVVLPIIESQNALIPPTQTVQSTVDLVEPVLKTNIRETAAQSAVQTHITETQVKDNTHPSFTTDEPLAASGSEGDNSAVIPASVSNSPEPDFAPVESPSVSGMTAQKRAVIASRQAETVKVAANVLTYRPVQMEVVEANSPAQTKTAEAQAAQSIPARQFVVPAMESMQSVTSLGETSMPKPNPTSNDEIRQSSPNTFTVSQPADHQPSIYPSQTMNANREGIEPLVIESKTGGFAQPVSATAEGAHPSTQTKVNQEVHAAEVNSFVSRADGASSSVASPQGKASVVQNIEPSKTGELVSSSPNEFSVSDSDTPDDRTNEKVVRQVHHGPEIDNIATTQGFPKPEIPVDRTKSENQIEIENGSAATPSTGNIEANSAEQVGVSAESTFTPAYPVEQALREPSSMNKLESAHTTLYSLITQEDDQPVSGVKITTQPEETQPAKRNTLKQTEAQEAHSAVTSPGISRADRLVTRLGDVVEPVQNTTRNFTAYVYEKVEPMIEDAMPTPKADSTVARPVASDHPRLDIQSSEQSAADIGTAEHSPATRMEIHPGDLAHAKSITVESNRVRVQDGEKASLTVKTFEGIDASARSETLSSSADQSIAEGTSEVVKQGNKRSLSANGTVEAFTSKELDFASNSKVEIESKRPVVSQPVSQEFFPGDTDQPVQAMAGEAMRQESQNILPDVKVDDETFAPTGADFTLQERSRSAFEEFITPRTAGSRIVVDSMAQSVQMMTQENQSVLSDLKGAAEIFAPEKVEFASATKVEAVVKEPVVPIAIRPQIPASDTDQPVQKTTREAGRQESKNALPDLKVVDQPFASPEMEYKAEGSSGPAVAQSQTFSGDTSQSVQWTMDNAVNQDNERSSPVDRKVVSEALGLEEVQATSAAKIETATKEPVVSPNAVEQESKSALSDTAVIDKVLLPKQEEFTATVKIQVEKKELVTTHAASRETLPDETDQPLQKASIAPVRQEFQTVSPDGNVAAEIFAPEKVAFVSTTKAEVAGGESVVPVVVRPQIFSGGTDQSAQMTTSETLRQESKNTLPERKVAEKPFTANEKKILPDGKGQPFQTTMSGTVTQANKEVVPDTKITDDTFSAATEPFVSRVHVETALEEPIVSAVVHPRILTSDADHPVQMATSEAVKQENENISPERKVVDQPFASSKATFTSKTEAEMAVEETVATRVVRTQTFSGDTAPVKETPVDAGRQESNTSPDGKVANGAFVSKGMEFTPTAKAGPATADSVAPDAVRSQIFSSDLDQLIQQGTEKAVRWKSKSTAPDGETAGKVFAPQKVELTPGAEMEYKAEGTPGPVVAQPQTFSGDTNQSVQWALGDAMNRDDERSLPADRKVFSEALVLEEVQATSAAKIEPATKEPVVSANDVEQEGKSALSDTTGMDKVFVPKQEELTATIKIEVEKEELATTHAASRETLPDDTDQPVQRASIDTVRQEFQTVSPDGNAVDEIPVPKVREFISTAEVESMVDESVVPVTTRSQTFSRSADQSTQMVKGETVKQDHEGFSAVDAKFTSTTNIEPVTEESVVSDVFETQTFFSDTFQHVQEMANPVQGSEDVALHVKVIADDAFRAETTRFVTMPEDEFAFEGPVVVRSQFPDDIIQAVQGMANPVEQESSKVLFDAEVFDEIFNIEERQFTQLPEVEAAGEEFIAPATVSTQFFSDDINPSIQLENDEAVKQNSEEGSPNVRVVDEVFRSPKVAPTTEAPAASRVIHTGVHPVDTDPLVQKVTTNAVRQNNEKGAPAMNVVEDAFTPMNIEPSDEEQVTVRAARAETYPTDKAQPAWNASNTSVAQPNEPAASDTKAAKDTSVFEKTTTAVPSKAETALEKPALARAVDSGTGVRPETQIMHDPDEIKDQEVNGTATRTVERISSEFPGTTEDVLSVSQPGADAWEPEVPKASVDMKKTMSTPEPTEANADVTQATVGQRKPEIEKDKAMPKPAMSPMTVPEAASLETNIEPETKVESSPVMAPEQEASHAKTIPPEKTVVVPVEAETAAAEVVSSTVYGDEVQNAETSSVRPEKISMPAASPDTTETRISETTPVFLEPKNPEKPIRVDQSSTLIEHAAEGSAQVENGRVDVKVTDPKRSSLEEKEKPATWHAPIAEMYEPVTGGPTVPSARTIKGIDTKEEIKLKHTGNDEELRLTEKRTEANQMPGSVTQAVGQANEAQAAEFNGKMPGEPVQAAEVARQVIRQVKVNLRNGSTSMHLKLNPKELGAIDVDMVSNAQGVQVTFFAEQASTGRLLETQLNQLREALVDSGVQLSGLNIGQHNTQEQKGGAFRHDTNSAPSSRQSFTERNDNRKDAPVERSIGQSSEVDYRI